MLLVDVAMVSLSRRVQLSRCGISGVKGDEKLMRVSYNNGMERRWHFKVGRSLMNLGEMQTGEEVRDRRERWAGGKQGNEDHRSLMKNLQWERRMRGFRNTSISSRCLVNFCYNRGKSLECLQDWRT